MWEFVDALPEIPGAISAQVTGAPPERLRREIWTLSWPVILSFALDSILGLIAMLMVGRLSAEAVGAVGLGTQVPGAVRAGIAAVGTGTIELVARDIGAGDQAHADQVMTQSVVFGVMVSGLIAIPVIVLARAALALFRVSGPMADMGARYLQVVMLSEPFQGVFLMCASALRWRFAAPAVRLGGGLLRSAPGADRDHRALPRTGELDLVVAAGRLPDALGAQIGALPSGRWAEVEV